MVTARIDLKGLNNELTGFKTAFDKWAQNVVSDADLQKDRHHNQLRELQNVIRSLYHHQQELEARAYEVQRRLQNEESEIQTLELELTKIQAEQNSLPTLISEVKALLKVEQQVAQEEADGIATRESSQDKVLSGIRSTLLMYKERLGLSLQQNRDNGSLAVGFRHINEEHPEQQFIVTVRILEDNLFQVLSCEPKLDALQDLVDTLNADNDFATFIRNIRKAFVNSIKS